MLGIHIQRRRWMRFVPLVAVVLIAAMVAFAPAELAMLASAATADDVASMHTTDTDFTSATTLDNVSVEGSGQSAVVETPYFSKLEFAYLDGSSNIKFATDNGTIRDTGADGQDIAGVTDADGDGDADIAFIDTSKNVKFVDADGNTIDTGADITGTNGFIGGAGDFDNDGDVDVAYIPDRTADDLYYVDTNGNIVDTGVQADQPGYMADMDQDGDQDIIYRDTSDNLKIIDSAGNVQDLGVDTTEPGPAGDIDGDGKPEAVYNTNGYLQYVDIDGQQTNSSIAVNNVGGVGDLDGDGDADVTYRDMNSDVKYVDHAGNVKDTGVTGISHPGGMGDIETAQVPATYVSPNHTASEVEMGWTNLSLLNANAEVTWQAWDGTSWVDIASTTYATGGNKTKSLSGDYDKWRVNVTFTATGGDFYAAVADEGLLFDATAPAIDNNSATPSGGATTTDMDVTLSVDVSDADFATAQGDTLTLEWYVDGTKKNTTTVNANGTASATVDVTSGGNHTWHVVVTDAYGDSTTSATFDFAYPAELRIYNESAPSNLVDQVTVEIRFYFEDGTQQIIEKSTSDGTVNMTGLPADQPFVVVAEANGYLFRRIYVESLVETQEVYLLPDSAEHRDVIFELADYTGDFPKEDTVLLVQRNINGSWKTVQGDFFGATGEWSAQLAYNIRHRLIIVNTETGERRRLGPFTPISSSTQQVAVLANGSIQLVGEGASVRVNPSTRSLPAKQTNLLSITVENQTKPLEYWNVSVWWTNGTVTQLLYNKNRTDPTGGTLSPSINLSGKAGGTLEVAVAYKTEGNQELVTRVNFSVTQVFTNRFSILRSMGSVAAAVPSDTQAVFTSSLAILATVLTATAVAAMLPVSTEGVGTIALLSATGFAVVGWLPWSLIFAVGVVLVVFAAQRRGL